MFLVEGKARRRTCDLLSSSKQRTQITRFYFHTLAPTYEDAFHQVRVYLSLVRSVGEFEGFIAVGPPGAWLTVVEWCVCAT